jgi:excisionase family DNA binding protein
VRRECRRANVVPICRADVLEPFPRGLSMGCMSTRLLSAAEVAEMPGVPTSWVYEQVVPGRIPKVALGRYRRFRQEAIARWIEQLESGSRRAA